VRAVCCIVAVALERAALAKCTVGNYLTHIFDAGKFLVVVARVTDQCGVVTLLAVGDLAADELNTVLAADSVTGIALETAVITLLAMCDSLAADNFCTSVVGVLSVTAVAADSAVGALLAARNSRGAGYGEAGRTLEHKAGVAGNFAIRAGLASCDIATDDLCASSTSL